MEPPKMASSAELSTNKIEELEQREIESDDTRIQAATIKSESIQSLMPSTSWGMRSYLDIARIICDMISINFVLWL